MRKPRTYACLEAALAFLVPAAGAGEVTDSGRPLARAEGVRFLRREAGRVVLDVGSGAYRFTATSAP